MISFDDFKTRFDFALEAISVAATATVGFYNRARIIEVLFRVGNGTATESERQEAVTGVRNGDVPVAVVSEVAQDLDDGDVARRLEEGVVNQVQ